MKEYAIYGRIIGGIDRPYRKVGKVVANDSRDALKKSRKAAMITAVNVTGVKLLGTLNPRYNPEKHLMAAIFGKRYRQKKYLSTRKRGHVR